MKTEKLIIEKNSYFLIGDDASGRRKYFCAPGYWEPKPEHYARILIHFDPKFAEVKSGPHFGWLADSGWACVKDNLSGISSIYNFALSLASPKKIKNVRVVQQIKTTTFSEKIIKIKKGVSR